MSFYETLNIPKTASVDEIKKSYYKLARKWHPDKNPNNKDIAEEKFKAISRAYEVLSDTQQKALYDQFGEEGLKRGASSAGFDHFNNIFQQFGGFPFGNNMFGQFQQNRPQQHAQQVSDINIQVTISLDVAYNGIKQASHRLKRKSYCQECIGTGSEDQQNHNCCDCNGTGTIERRTQLGPMTQILRNMCQKCRGAGRTEGYSQCLVCAGSCVVDEDYAFNFDVPRGAAHDEKIIISNAGHVKLNNSPLYERHNIIVTIINKQETRQDGISRGQGLDLCITLIISLAEALCGFKKQITHFNGRIIDVEYADLCPPGTVLTIKNEGMHRGDRRGNMIVKLDLKFPNIIHKRLVWDALEPHIPYIERSTDSKTGIFNKDNEPINKPEEEANTQSNCRQQ